MKKSAALPFRPKLLDQVRAACRTQHLSTRTEKAYVGWIRRYVRFHGLRHPSGVGAEHVRYFLSHLATEGRVAASTQNQAFSALLFLYRIVLGRDLWNVGQLVRARKPKRLPVVLTPEGVRRMLARLSGTHQLVASLLYASGLPVMEALLLRVKDENFAYSRLVVRDGQGEKDRATVLPASLKEPFQRQLRQVKLCHEEDLAAGYGSVHLPYELERNYLNAAHDEKWQYVFPAPHHSHDPRTGRVRRHPLSDKVIQLAVRRAVRVAGVGKPASCHPLRHSLATHLIEQEYDVRTEQELLGHKDVRTTQIHTHVLRGV